MLIVFDVLGLRFTSHHDQSIVRICQQRPGAILFDVKNQGSSCLKTRKTRKTFNEAKEGSLIPLIRESQYDSIYFSFDTELLK